MKNIPFLAAALAALVLASGCAGPEKKFGRGVNNIYEPIRMAELRRSIEQATLYDAPDSSYHTGVIRGLNRTLARTGVGIYEIITAPFPPYDPVFTNYLPPKPDYPDSYEPGLISDSVFDTDTSLGFSGGDVAPFIPGSRFRVFDR
jgi:putative exosortase-associated protein (TIGR04073 family)